MKANELRIGNWIQSKRWLIGENYDWWEWKVTSEDIVQIESNLQTIPDQYAGIPLTEEWLVKFGFVYSDDDGIVSYSKKDIIIFLIFGLDFYFKLNHYKHAPIEFVHQLQNLYFALTGEELTINN